MSCRASPPEPPRRSWRWPADQVGSFGHAEATELLRAAGAQVVTLDPFADEVLPAGTRALVVGGALPESYAEQLSANRRLCIAVAELARTGRPVVAEGAGLLWLAREVDGLPMCGVLDAIGSVRDGLVVGYREATAQSDSVIVSRGEVVTGHKEHRAVLSPRGGQRPAWSWPGGAPEGFVWRGVHASQLVPHWAAYPRFAARLVAAAAAEPVPDPDRPDRPDRCGPGGRCHADADRPGRSGVGRAVGVSSRGAVRRAGQPTIRSDGGVKWRSGLPLSASRRVFATAAIGTSDWPSPTALNGLSGSEMKLAAASSGV